MGALWGTVTIRKSKRTLRDPPSGNGLVKHRIGSKVKRLAVDLNISLIRPAQPANANMTNSICLVQGAIAAILLGAGSAKVQPPIVSTNMVPVVNLVFGP